MGSLNGLIDNYLLPIIIVSLILMFCSFGFCCYFRSKRKKSRASVSKEVSKEINQFSTNNPMFAGVTPPPDVVTTKDLELRRIYDGGVLGSPATQQGTSKSLLSLSQVKNKTGKAAQALTKQRPGGAML